MREMVTIGRVYVASSMCGATIDRSAPKVRSSNQGGGAAAPAAAGLRRGARAQRVDTISSVADNHPTHQQST